MVKIVLTESEYRNIENANTIDVCAGMFIILKSYAIVIVAETDPDGFNDTNHNYHGWKSVVNETSMADYIEYKRRQWVR